MTPQPRAGARVAALGLLLTVVVACGGGGGTREGAFDVPTPTGSPTRRAGATVPAGTLRPPSPARMFAGSASVVGRLTRYCKGSCMESSPAAPDYLSAPGGAFVVFTVGETPVEAVAHIRVKSGEEPALVRLNPSTLMVFNHGLGTGRFLVDLIVKWRTSEARWRFGLNVTD